MLFPECSDRCGSCQPEDQTICITCQYLISQTGECLENTSCAELGFEVGETGCGELLMYSFAMKQIKCMHIAILIAEQHRASLSASLHTSMFCLETTWLLSSFY